MAEIVIDEIAENSESTGENPVERPKIKTLRFTNFRAFPGPSIVSIPFSGKNIVIYGENGSGKSTVFHALDGFFSISETSKSARKNRLNSEVNLFSPHGPDETWVEVEFTDGSIEKWTSEQHPCDLGTSQSARVYGAAYRKAFLDYRALLETNFRHSKGSINLFDVCIQSALRDFQTSHDGSEKSLRDLWLVLEKHINPPSGKMWIGRNRDERNLYRNSFNSGLQEALDALLPIINEMLSAMGWEDTKIEHFEFPRLTYNDEWMLKLRNFNGKTIRPMIKFNTEELLTPHLSLNEARQSALALAIYFAGRKLCGETGLEDIPKIMVLDDVIVGLDQSNRLPVLDLLAEHFKDWQIVVLTHDRIWFDMTRSYHRRHRADRFWNYSMLHPSDSLITPATALPVGSSAPVEALKRAKAFLESGHVNAAGNATRIAAERAIREFCEEKSIPVKYKGDPEKIPFSELYTAAKKWSGKSTNGVYGDVLDNLKMYTEILLNRLSHGGTPSIERHEVRGAITATDALLLALNVRSKFE